MTRSRSGRPFVWGCLLKRRHVETAHGGYDEDDTWQSRQLNGYASRILAATSTSRFGCYTCCNMWTCIVLHWSLRREGVRKCCVGWCYQLPHCVFLVGSRRNKKFRWVKKNKNEQEQEGLEFRSLMLFRLFGKPLNTQILLFMYYWDLPTVSQIIKNIFYVYI